MISIQVIEIKNFMVKLLVRDTFDDLLMQQARVLTASELVLQGKRRRSWYDTEEWQRMETASDPDWMTWGEMRETVFAYIRGKKPPQRMWIDLLAARGQGEKMITDSGFVCEEGSSCPSLHLQVRYERGELMLVTAVSTPGFTLDRRAEHAWDEACCRYLKQKGVVFVAA